MLFFIVLLFQFRVILMPLGVSGGLFSDAFLQFLGQRFRVLQLRNRYQFERHVVTDTLHVVVDTRHEVLVDRLADQNQ